MITTATRNVALQRPRRSAVSATAQTTTTTTANFRDRALFGRRPDNSPVMLGGALSSTRNMSANRAGRAMSTVAMAKKKKDVRLVITLECTEAREIGATPSRYTTEKV